MEHDTTKTNNTEQNNYWPKIVLSTVRMENRNKRKVCEAIGIEKHPDDMNKRCDATRLPHILKTWKHWFPRHIRHSIPTISAEIERKSGNAKPTGSYKPYPINSSRLCKTTLKMPRSSCSIWLDTQN